MRSQVTEQVKLFLDSGCKWRAFAVAMAPYVAFAFIAGLTAYFGPPVAGAAIRLAAPLLQ